MEHVSIEELLERFAEMDCYVLSLLNPDASIAYEPPYITELTGFEVEDYLGKSALDFIHPEDRPKIVGLLDQLYRDPNTWNKKPVVYRWQHKQGHWLTVNSSGVLLKHKGQLQGMLLISHDITDHQREVDGLKTRIQELEAELELLRESMRHEQSKTPQKTRTPINLKALPHPSRDKQRTNMIKLFDHELRTPLHTIQGYVELLMEEHADQEIKTELERVHQSSQQLHGLIEHLVELARYEEEDMDIQLERIAMGPLCKAFALRAGSPVEFVWNENIQRHEVYTDRGKLMLTLVEQARFLSRQGVSLKLHVEITREGGVSLCWRIPQHLLSQVTRSHLAQVFKPQFELDATAWGRHYLALHLGKRRLMALGGKMSIKHVASGMMCWENKLRPRRFGLAAESSAGIDSALESSPQYGALPDVLYVGEDATHEEALTQWAARFGLSFHMTRAQDELLHMFSGPRHSTCLCLLDVMSPHFDGWHMLAELNKARLSHHIKIIVYSVVEDVDLATELGADACINTLQPLEITYTRLEELLAEKR